MRDRPRSARRRAMVAAVALAGTALVSTILQGAVGATTGRLRPVTAASGPPSRTSART